MDFIEQLPPSLGFTAILVIIDCLSKQGIFIPTVDMITFAQLAELFVLHIFSKHGIPSHCTSNCGSEFVSHFFLGTVLDMQLHFTSGYHPQADGQTERVNQTLEQYLQTFCNFQQDNWLSLLPLAEFTYNNAPNETTGVSPFFANKGYHPNLTVHPECDIASART
jgi:IS30 family transposase